MSTKVTAALLLAFLAGPGCDLLGPGEADFAGVAYLTEPQDSIANRVWITVFRSSSRQNGPGERAGVLIGWSADLQFRDSLRSARPDPFSIVVGDTLEVWREGALVLDSDPPQYGARRVLVR